jgi:hypothetical protein
VIAGHFGLAAAVKSRVPRAPLWSLMLATVWLDVLFVPLLLLGVETIVPAAGAGSPPGYGEGIIYADYTHSLLGAIVLSALFGALIGWRWGRVAGLATSAVALSHWLLDLPMHRHDMPFLPANLGHLPRLGFGLWQWPTASASLELALVLVGTLLYWRAAVHVAQTHAEAGSDALVHRAHVTAATLLASGIVTLAVSVAGQ